MDGMHALLFVEFTFDFKKTSMIVKKISKELVDHNHDVTVVDTEAYDLLSVSDELHVTYLNNNNNNNNISSNNNNQINSIHSKSKSNLSSVEMKNAREHITTCDVMLFISPKNEAVLPKCVNKLIKNVNSVVLSRWCLQGVSCFVIARQVKKTSVAQYIWKMLRKFESNGLHNALAPWHCYEWEQISNIQETALPSV